MPSGTLEVLLVGAKDLEESSFFSKMDPYILLSLRTQEKKSTVLEGKGSEPEWNETFVFTVTSDDVTELNLKIMDKDTFSSDDFVGEATIPLEPVFMEGKLPPTSYSVVNEDKEYHGEITVGLTFTPERTSPRGEDYGGNEGSYGDSRRSYGDSRRSYGDSRGERYDDDSRGGYGDDSRGGYDDDSRRGCRDSRERYGDDDSRRGYGDSGECYGNDTRRGYGHSREGYDDDDSRGGYGDSRGSRGGWKESSRCEEESYGGYKESSYRG